MNRLDITLSSARVALEAVVVNDRSECRVRPDSGASAFVVWEEARKALVAAALTGREPLTMTTSVEDRTFDRGGHRVLADSTSSRTAASTSPFASLAADSLVKVGYVTTSATGERTYWAPDADVLLSDAFLETHCLRTVRSDASASTGDRLIGVAFDPATRRRNVVDVSGVLWIDRTNAELRSLEYRYVNAPAIVEEATSGGRVEFLRIPGGRWIADRWSIRYPIVARGGRRADAPVVPGQLRPVQPGEELVGLKTTSGSVSEIKRGSDVLWERGRVSTIVRVVDSATSAPIRGVLVRVVGATSATATDSSGQVRLDRVTPGSLTLRLESAELSSLGLSPHLASIDVSDVNDAMHDVRVPSARAIVVARCGATTLDWGDGMLRGSLAAGSATTPLVVAWQTPYARLGGGPPVIAVEERTVTPGAGGAFELCGVPRDATISIRRARADSSAATIVRFTPGAVAAAVVVP
jgi:hypothetical protein